MPRPRKDQNLVLAIADGKMLLWHNGVFSGDDREQVAAVRRAAATALPVPLTESGPVLPASDFDALGATCALLAAKPGRVIILRAPESVFDRYPPADPDDDVILEIDGVEQVPSTSVYTTDQQRQLFDLPDAEERANV